MSFTSEIERIRDDFPMLKKKMHNKPLVYLDSAATTQKPMCVIKAICNFYQNDYATVNRGVYEISTAAGELYWLARQKVQNFLGAKEPEEIVFTRGTTESLNLLAYSFGETFLKKGDEIIISEVEHHANFIPWVLLRDKLGIIVKTIPVFDNGELDLEVYKKLLTSKTKLVGIAHMTNVTGTINPIKKIAELAHKVGAWVCCDAAQSALHLPLNVVDLDVDFLAFSGHKIFGPMGIGVLYGKRDLLEQMVPYQTGGDVIQTVSLEKIVYKSAPFKFEAGTPNVADVIGLGAAIDYIQALGKDKIAEAEKRLLEYATAKMKDIKGLKIIGEAKEKGPVISFYIEGVHPLDIGSKLDFKGIAIRTGKLCSHPTMDRFNLDKIARASFCIYNTFEEIDYFCEVLKKIDSLHNP